MYYIHKPLDYSDTFAQITSTAVYYWWAKTKGNCTCQAFVMENKWKISMHSSPSTIWHFIITCWHWLMWKKGLLSVLSVQPVRWHPNHCHLEQHDLTYWCKPMCKTCLRLSLDTTQPCRRCQLNCHPNPEPIVLWCNLFGYVRITVT